MSLGTWWLCIAGDGWRWKIAGHVMSPQALCVIYALHAEQ